MIVRGKGCAPRFILTIGVVSFTALIVTTTVGAIVPASLRLVAPVACPSESARAVVVTTVSHPQPGQTNMSADLVCIDAHGLPERAGFLRTWGSAFGFCWLASLLLITTPALLHRLRFGVRKNGDEA
jgi:hypothetical protein